MLKTLDRYLLREIALAWFVVTKITDSQEEKWELREQYQAIDDDLLVLTAERDPR